MGLLVGYLSELGFRELSVLVIYQSRKTLSAIVLINKSPYELPVVE